MVAEGEVTSELEHFKHVLPELRYELGSAVTDDTIGKTMMPKYFTHNNSCGFFTSDFFSTGHEMCHLSISIYYF